MKFAFCAPLAIGCSPTRSMSAQVDASDCRLAVRVCPVTDGELEPVVAEVLELAAEIERLQRSVRVPGRAGTHLRCHTHPLTDEDSLRVIEPLARRPRCQDRGSAWRRR